MHTRLHAIIIAVQCCFMFSTNYAMDEPEKTKKIKKTQTTFGALAGAISPTLEKHIDGELPAIANNPYRLRNGVVTHNTGINPEEQLFLTHRLPVAKAALEKMLRRPLVLEQVPTIAIVCSGGGYRAMLYTTGALSGAEKIGLLDATTYITGLSGSTWAIAPWISSGMPLKEFKPYIQKCVSKPFAHLTHNEKILVANAIAVKKRYNQPRTLVDPYGDCLGNRLLNCFADSKQMIYLSDQAKRIAQGKYPYPIYTAINSAKEMTHDPIWYEFTPHTVGNYTNNTHIPTWSFGRKFKNGVSINDAPEKTLGYLMGLWGSKFAPNLDDIREKISHRVALDDEKHDEIITPFQAEVSNYLYKADNLPDEELAKHKHMQFVDASLNAHLPYAPVSGLCSKRKADILIFLDISAEEIGIELTKAAAFAAQHKLLFPLTVDECKNLTELNKKTIHIFKDKKNRSCPVVIYMPRVSDKDLWDQHKYKSDYNNFGLLGFNLDYETKHGCCQTKKFQYTQPESELVMNQAEFNMRANKDKLIKTINWAIDRQAQ